MAFAICQLFSQKKCPQGLKENLRRTAKATCRKHVFSSHNYHTRFSYPSHTLLTHSDLIADSMRLGNPYPFSHASRTQKIPTPPQRVPTTGPSHSAPRGATPINRITHPSHRPQPHHGGSTPYRIQPALLDAAKCPCGRIRAINSILSYTRVSKFAGWHLAAHAATTPFNVSSRHVE